MSSLRDSIRFRTYPGLTSWANISRPYGAGSLRIPPHLSHETAGLRHTLTASKKKHEFADRLKAVPLKNVNFFQNRNVIRVSSTQINHHGADGHRSASHESAPHRRPAAPTATPSDAITGTSSSHIHEVPHSETHRLPR